MGAFADLSIQVTSFDYQPVQQAQVTAEREGRTILSGSTDERGRIRIERDDGAELLIRIEAPGFAGDERSVTGDRPDHVELFVLGQPGMPFYYRGTVRVPFEPVDDAVGVLLRNPGERSEEDLAASADGIARSIGAEMVRSHVNFARSGIAVVGTTGDHTRGAEALLDELGQTDGVERAGAIVKLFDNNASFLTNTVIARFVEGVDDERVATIAARHGLTPDGRIHALGRVYRLRFAGLASYAVLDASNALADEDDVVFAEPDLIHTVEEDSIVPTDFLFPQQWDHSIINTPDAWQELRDLDSNRTFGSPDVIIAVVDSGVDATHPEFTGNLSNGQPKLYHVFDFANMVANMSSLPSDHGTACASAATARTNNSSNVVGVNEGIAGVAGNCRLIGVRRGGSDLDYSEMYLWTAGLDANSSKPGFPAQITPGADVISNSFGASIGSPISGLMSNTFDALTDSGRGGGGILLFFSAGNDNSDLDVTFDRPWGMYERCFCVAASTLANDGATETKAGYSSFGSTVDFCAPSDDWSGFHNPPTSYGAHAATIQAAPDGEAIPGRPDRRTTLTVAVAAGATTLTLATVAGMAAGQALMIGTPGAAHTEGRPITAVNAVLNQLAVTPALRNAHGAGTAIVSGPRSYQSNFGGTSYATPVCAGIGALMLSAAPRLRWDEARNILYDTAIKIDQNNTDPIGRWRDRAGQISTDPGYAGPQFSEFFGFGRIDAAAAVRDARLIGEDDWLTAILHMMMS
ncbi:S8 family serine peptidase [Rhodococcus sp. NCIMB 12038]|uniref:S8 family serine peptidase n=1 Tax=Rhodococcus sp. NCIMB 12038 TaxID=933800 RepID=UPI0015C69658|nr:S8 family serine peptidase [Rhodococcus sp. NCIMB 12038]